MGPSKRTKQCRSASQLGVQANENKRQQNAERAGRVSERLEAAKEHMTPSMTAKARTSGFDINDLPGNQGRMPPGSAFNTRCIIMVVRVIFICSTPALWEEMCTHTGVDMAAFLLGISKSAAYEYYNHFKQTGQILGKGETREHVQAISREEAPKLREYVHELRTKKQHAVELPDIQKWLAKTFNKTISPSRLWHSLKKLGFVFGRTRKFTIRKELPEYMQKVLGYLDAKDKYTAEEYVFVYLDESYVNKNHRREYTWYHKDDEIGSGVGGPAGRGERLIILTGITEKGILGLKGWPGQESLGSLLMWQASKSTGDYHKNMNHTNFEKWLVELMIPAVKAAFPGRKVCFVMDNAPYHCVLPDDIHNFKDSKKWPLAKLKEWCRTNNVDFVEKGPGVSWAQATKRDELVRRATAKQLENMGGKLAYRVQRIVENSDDPEMAGWKVLYTPPYYPELQPIELLWGNVKNKVARDFKGERNMTKLEEEVANAFLKFGTSTHCTHLIKSVEKYDDLYRTRYTAALQANEDANPMSDDDDDGDDMQGHPDGEISEYESEAEAEAEAADEAGDIIDF